jgi:CDP-diacylglycerol--glycerol-3-phosphate 3-phosphatidyltransferase
MSAIGQRSTINVSFIGKVKTFVQIFAILFLLYQQPFFGLPSLTLKSHKHNPYYCCLVQ